MLKQPDYKNIGLLDYLENQLDVTYLSDMRSPEHSSSLFMLLSKIPPDWFSQEEWADAAGYLMAQDQIKQYVEQKASETLRQEILEHLTQIQG